MISFQWYVMNIIFDLCNGILIKCVRYELHYEYPGLLPELSSEPSFPDLMNEVAAFIPHKWRQVGIQLGVSHNDLVSFASVSIGDPDRCFMAVFSAWKNCAAINYTWHTLIKALEAPIVGENRLARELRTKLTRTL